MSARNKMPVEFRHVDRSSFDAVVAQRDRALAEVERVNAALRRAHRALTRNRCHTAQTARDEQWQDAVGNMNFVRRDTVSATPQTNAGHAIAHPAEQEQPHG